jgi:hypothetical protein
MTPATSVDEKDENPDATEAADVAWVSIETRLEPAELLEFIDDVERLLRINPLFEFRKFQQTDAASYFFQARNLSNGHDVDVSFRVHPLPNGIGLCYADGLKSQTRFEVEAGHPHALLRISDDYTALPQMQRRQRLDEVDRSITAWGRALHDYLRLWKRWHWLPPWRWYMTSVWQPMRPSTRRIVYMIWMISLFEMVALFIVGAILIAIGGIGGPA